MLYISRTKPAMEPIQSYAFNNLLYVRSCLGMAESWHRLSMVRTRGS
jgi:hypothetical protein